MNSPEGIQAIPAGISRVAGQPESADWFLTASVHCADVKIISIHKRQPNVKFLVTLSTMTDESIMAASKKTGIQTKAAQKSKKPQKSSASSVKRKTSAPAKSKKPISKKKPGRKPSPKDLNAFREGTVRVGDVRLHAAIWPGFKKNKKRNIVCIHGTTGNYVSLSRITETFVEQGYTTLAYDLRGRGRSDKPETGYSQEIHVEDLQRLLSETRMQNVVLVGHSLGAYIAFRFALKYPEKVSGIIAIDGGAPLNLWQKLRALTLVQKSVRRLGRSYTSPNQYLAEIQKTGIIRKFSPLVENFLLYELEALPGGKFKVGMPASAAEQEIAAMGGSLSWWRILKNFIFSAKITREKMKAARLKLEDIKVPVLLLKAGTHNFSRGDDVVPVSAVKKMQERITSLQIEIFEEYNHYEIIIEPDMRRNRLLNSFAFNIFQNYD